MIQDNTRVVMLESPGSITMEVQDIPAIVRAVRAKNPAIVIMLDNTWAAGILLKALDLGVDISLQAGTKYLIGHSDTMIGTAGANARCWDQLHEQSYLMGQMVDADTAYMAARGLRPLGVRLKQHEENGLRVARWLGDTRIVRSWLLHLPAHYHLRAYTMFNRHGLTALLVGRFLVFVRTLLPTMAGISGLSNTRFQLFNWLSALLWVTGLVTLGYAISHVPVVKHHEDQVMMALIVLPVVVVVTGLIGSVLLIIRRRRVKSA